MWKSPILAVRAFTFTVCMFPLFRKAFDCIKLVLEHSNVPVLLKATEHLTTAYLLCIYEKKKQDTWEICFMICDQVRDGQLTPSGRLA